MQFDETELDRVAVRQNVDLFAEQCKVVLLEGWKEVAESFRRVGITVCLYQHLPYFASHPVLVGNPGQCVRNSAS